MAGRPWLVAALAAAACLGGVRAAAAPAATSSRPLSTARLEALEIDLVRAEDVRAIKRLQRAYGYYADRGLWNELAELFTEDAVANYPSGGFDGKASIHAMFVQNLGQGRQGLAAGRIYNHTILQPVVDLAADGATATGRWRVLGMLGRLGASATWADSLYRFDYVKQGGRWKIRELTAYAGSGGRYETGWVAPQPRPPGAADTSPVRFNLAHPADRPWRDPCEDDVSACVVPFPYPNRSVARPNAPRRAVLEPRPTMTPEQRAQDLVQRARRLQDEQAVLNLQAAYGYYVDRGLWGRAAALFAPDGTREEGLAGVMVGRRHIARSLARAAGGSARAGLRDGQLNDHLQLEPIVTVAPDGQTAKARIFELAFTGGGGVPARIHQNVQENDYVRRDGTWMIQALRVFTILLTDYDQGWARSALPAPRPAPDVPPDRPPTVVYEAYPAFFTPPLHFEVPSRSAMSPAAPPAGGRAPDERELATAERQVREAGDYDEIANLQGAYGYYAEKSLWSELVPLFTRGATLRFDGAVHAGREGIAAFLASSGPEGPVKGSLDSQLQLQPVIHVAADGRSAHMRSRLLELLRDAEGRPMWGGGLYESTLVKEGGVWKYQRLDVQHTYRVPYAGGWASRRRAAADGVHPPSRAVLPFHYRDPISGL